MEFQAQVREPTTKEIDKKVEGEIQQWILSQLPRKVSSSEVREKAKLVFQENGRAQIECSYGWYRRFMSRTKKSENTSSLGVDSSDSLILGWLLQLYDNNQLVSYKELQWHAQNALIDIRPSFKASASWALRFLKRNHLVINCEGLYTHTLPPELEHKMTCYRDEVKQIMTQLPDTCVGCMDEIPVIFSCPKINSNLDPTFEGITNDTISHLRKVSINNCDATAVLGILADGTFLPPMVIVKAQLSSSMNQVYMPSTSGSKVVTYYDVTTKPTLSSLEKWLDLVWSKSTHGPKSLLILDSYEIHSLLMKSCVKLGTECKLIPPGCSIKLQPLNVMAKTIFKKNMEKLWMEYLKPTTGLSPILNPIKLPSTTEIVEWVNQSYDEAKSMKVRLCPLISHIKGGTGAILSAVISSLRIIIHQTCSGSALSDFLNVQNEL